MYIAWAQHEGSQTGPKLHPKKLILEHGHGIRHEIRVRCSSASLPPSIASADDLMCGGSDLVKQF